MSASVTAPRARARRLALLSIAVATLVFALKLLAWRLTGSVALFSDAMETVVNVLAAAVTWWAIEYASRPADDDHPFGHHKAEYLAAVLEGVLITGAAVLIATAAFADLARIGEGKVLTAVGPGVAVNLLAAAINGGWAAYLVREAARLRSPALAADAHHIRADVITSVGVVAGLLLAIATGWLVLDPLMALVVAAVVVWQGSRLLLASIGGLMDRVVDEGEAEAIRATIRGAMEGAIEAHDIRMREAGAAIFVECHLVVPARMSVGAAHRICDRIEAAVEGAHPHAAVTIHVEPEEEALGEGEGDAMPAPDPEAATGAPPPTRQM